MKSKWKHEWEIVDMVVDVMENDFLYLIHCKECGETREIYEGQLERMLSLGLIEL